MICKNCGCEIAEGAKFCGSCGTAVEQPVESAPVEAPVAPVEAPAAVETPAAETPAAEAAPKADIMATVKERLKELGNTVKPYLQKYKLPLVGVAAVLFLLMSIAIIVGVLTAGNGFIAFENGIMVNTVEDEVVVLWNKKVIKTGIEASYIEDSATSLDGTVYAALTDSGTLFFVRNGKAKVIAEEVVTFLMSSSGKGIAYICEGEEESELNLYNVGSKKNTVVDDEYMMYAALLGMELSPDGKSLAYYAYDEEEGEASLMYFSGKKSVKITSSEVELIGLSNGGKYIYVLGENDDGESILYSYNKKGDRKKLNTCSGESFYFNDDHTQILFTNDGKSYISSKGKEAKKISSGTARLLLTEDSMSFSGANSTTYPVDDLYGHVYNVNNDGKRGLWLIKKNENSSKKLVSEAYSAQLDAQAEYIYYLNDDADLKVLKISHGENASDKAKELAEDVSSFVVTSNRKKVYYVSEDGLYSCNGKNGSGRKTIASEDVSSSLVINAKDVVYYRLDGDLYACSNGRKGTKVLSDVSGMMGFPNGVVYAGDEDAIYVTTGSKKLKKLLDME